ncbi:class IV lanthionine synthetase LanL [Actinopolymorpha alba]|uniref:class IV lanthionine synthetase LanL n=1 Tax=Actinopolymorpha alba TaxID=533267 RepID=UPI00036D4C1F|nr:class IV lanthionine synthetase LanL [Actinopolymorpha alba]
MGGHLSSSVRAAGGRAAGTKVSPAQPATSDPTATSDQAHDAGSSHRPAGANPDLAEQARALLPEGTWEFRVGPRWCVVRPPDRPERTQGWKLHLSATPLTAPQVLARAIPVLRAYGVAFKFAPTIEAVRRLTSRDCERGESGKFLTVYPNDDPQAPRLAADLHAATQGLTGPRILTDRQYRPGSVVHYRYGGFGGEHRLDDDGVRRYVLTAPDGSHLEDRREAWFTPPTWAPSPFGADPEGTRSPASQPGAPGQAGGGQHPIATTARTSNAVLLGGRFVVHQAIRHSPKGGIYLATDRERAIEVVVKHARAYVEADVGGTDVRDRLRHEAAMLHRLAGQVPVPAVVEFFQQDGDAFLAEERLAGQPFRRWVRTSTGGASTIPTGQILTMARHLVAVVAGVHSVGVVLRDLSPGNVLVAPNGGLALVDLEAAAPAGVPAPVIGTPGYRAPESQHPRQPVTAAFTEDLWSLGGLLFLLATANDPVLADDQPADRPLSDRLASWLLVVARDNLAARLLTPPILGLLAMSPDRRWSLTRVEKYLAELAEVASQRAGSAVRATPLPDRRPLPAAALAPPIPPPSAERLWTDGLDYLLATMTPDEGSAERLWPTHAFGRRTDPGNVQHGAAGILAVLLEALPHVTDPTPLRAAIQRAAGWLAAHQPARDPVRAVPGLYFGRSGTAWALADAGRALQDPDLVSRAVNLALSLPVAWPNPDVTHGLAGAGLAHLHLARHTGDPRLAERVKGYADAVVAAADKTDLGPLWPIPADTPSRLAGARHYGFAHGVAGIGYFLLAAGRATGTQAYLDLAVEAGHTLCRTATTDAHGAAWWPVGPDDQPRVWGQAGEARAGAEPQRRGWAQAGGARVGPEPHSRLPHWCSGASGVGTFLLRLYAVTDVPAFGAYAAAAAVAVHRARWQAAPATCHGLAGDGQYLLDAAELLAEDSYRGWAGDLVEAMAVRHCRRDGRLLIPDESGQAVVADYQAGVAGVIAFLQRFTYGGPRPWMVDACLTETLGRSRAC